jgi:hypothetical protein
VKSAGARSAGNSHAACDVAGVGDGITELPKRARRWKRRIQPRNFLRIYAPALDPTRLASTESITLVFAFRPVRHTVGIFGPLGHVVQLGIKAFVN